MRRYIRENVNSSSPILFLAGRYHSSSVTVTVTVTATVTVTVTVTVSVTVTECCS